MKWPGRRGQAVIAAALIAIGGAAVGIGRWNAARDRAEAARIASVLLLEPGSSVADVGAGEGDFTIELARVIGASGRVFATEVDPELLTAVERAAADAGVENVTVREAGDASTGLPDACCQAALIRTVYHHLSQPDAIDAGLFRALRPGGRLLIIDFKPSGWLSFIAPVRNVPSNRGGHGVSPEIVTSELGAAGFVLERRIDDWRGGNYALLFRRPVHREANPSDR